MKHLLKTIATVAVLGTFTGCAMAQSTSNSQTPTPPAPPPPFCENNPGFDDWNFWVGEWNVYSNDENRTFAGTNSIKKEYNNCLMTETWVSAGGNGGFSINYYNAVTKKWRQVWVANGYNIDYTGGLNEDGAMVLTGFITGYNRNVETPFRGTWSKLEGTNVRQFFEIHNAEGEWTTWFDGLYVKKETDPNPPENN